MTISIGTIDLDAYLGVGIFLIVLTAILIVMRCASSLKLSKKLLIDDYLSIFGFIVTTAFFAFNKTQYDSFFKPADLRYYTATGIAVPVLASASMWISKTPVLLLYVRIFGVYRWMRIASYALLVTSGIGLLLAMVPTWQSCHPLDNELTALKWKACGRAVLTAGVAQGAVSVTADLLILLLPLYPIARLNLSARRKVGLGIVFCSGVFGVLASLLALLYKIHLYQGAQSDKGGMLTTMLLQFVECAIALMVGCVPSARGYWVGQILPSRFYTSVASFGTRLLAPSTWGTRRSTRSNTSYRETKYADNFGDHERQMGGASSEEYIRMEAGVNNHSRNPST